ncbi:MAG: hypothetical protein AAFO62_07240 [Pseudomonadota bacterium]
MDAAVGGDKDAGKAGAFQAYREEEDTRQAQGASTGTQTADAEAARKADADAHDSADKANRPATTIPTVKPADAPLAKRLLAAIDLQLKELESRMAMSEDLTSADYERETRALGGLIRNYEKIIGLDAANDNRARKAGDHDARPTDASGADADSVRRDVAARLVRLRARLDDGTGSADHGAE